MTGPIFVDTNILVYSRDARYPEKQARAHEVLAFLWESKLGRISYQILNEYYVTVTRKLKPGMDQASARCDMRDLLTWKPLRSSENHLNRAWEIESRYQLSWWDSLVLASAIEAGCDRIFSEDLQHGMTIFGIMIENPFHSDFQLPKISSPTN